MVPPKLFLCRYSRRKFRTMSKYSMHYIFRGSKFIISDFYSRTRGKLNAFYDPAYNLGCILAFLLANFFDCVTQAKFHLILPVIFLISFVGIPQTPQHLINLKMHKVRIADETQVFLFKKHYLLINLLWIFRQQIERINFSKEPN